MDDLKPVSTQIIEVLVPDIGDFKDVPIIEILAVPGARVGIDETLVVLESDKATIDVPSPVAGIIKELRVQINDRVSKGSALLLLEVGVAVTEISESPIPNSAPSETKALECPPDPLPTTTGDAAQMRSDVLPHASPLARRFARELGVSLGEVAGTGPKGRILRNDIQAFVKRAVTGKTSTSNATSQSGLTVDLLPWPQIDFEKYGPIERSSLSKIKKISGANLSRNSIIIPHVTNFDQADITGLEKFRVETNAKNVDKNGKLTMLSFMIKASVVALKTHPLFNASLDGDELILKQYFNIGFAADTPNGLVVPVIKDADKKGLRTIAAEAAALAAQARDGTLKAGAMQGGCFTISSLGGIGGDGFTPIINAPEVAILGAARAKMAPVWDGAGFVPRLMMPVSLSWDHRVIDGAEAARFLVTFTDLLTDFRRVCL